VTEIRRSVERYQILRMRETHADLIASADYGPLCEFFFNDIYAPRDFRKRDEAFHTLARKLKSAIPERVFGGIAGLLELSVISDALDTRLAAALRTRGCTADFTCEEFEDAYAACDNYALRIKQIALVDSSLEFTHHLSQLPSIEWITKGAVRAAKFFHVGEIAEFLEKGSLAFRRVPDLTVFRAAMRDRETKYVNRLFGKEEEAGVRALPRRM